MRRITIKLDEVTAEWVRARAAQLNTSVSRFIADLLVQQKHAAGRYESAWQWFRERERRPLTQTGEACPRRVDLYNRPGVR